MATTLSTERNMHYLEDRIMKMPGLYTMWMALYRSCFCMAVSDHTGPARDFLMITAGLSTVFLHLHLLIWHMETICCLLLLGGPIYQYIFKKLHIIAEMSRSHAPGVMNAIEVILQQFSHLHGCQNMVLFNLA